MAKAKRAKKAKRRGTRKVTPIPEGMRAVTPYLAIRGAAEAIEWYKRAFGAREMERRPAPGGMILHARMKVGDSMVMLSDIFPGSPHKSPLDLGTTPVVLHMYARDAQALWDRAVAAGASVLSPLTEMFWGEKYGLLGDPYGHHWSVSQRTEILSEKEQARRAEEFSRRMMAQATGGPLG